ncbi:Gfo/Idh/MocA family protein [Pedobacter mendelii]|uniref:Oxidoreductase n=1 Tax=Pedobacter mendelii TaxID=1908240 RepID=A0ABQ2BHR3_9SPHI|nr:Gfo/Idh/MocA family oxidoreductase [Pedobacter mendelii]GGI23687.1 oxidoreductase [Pedobacter mendelii]
MIKKANVFFLIAAINLVSIVLFGFNLKNNKVPLRVGIIGLTHTHVHGILSRKDKGDIKIVGIVEPNKELAKRYMDQYGMSMDLVFNSTEEMLNKANPEAVYAFNTIYQHLETVEACAPRGIHVMVEKPLAVSLAHAKKMEALAMKYKIQLLTNYETTWYPSNEKSYEMLNENALGDVRKIVVHDGHKGPKEIGVNKEFLDWLTDPVQNGGGVITDFGCYGANLMTWLMNGERPQSVMAVSQQIKPEIYPKVDDEATFILTYPKAQGIIQASWNWPFARKDMEVYGTKGYVIAENGKKIRFRLDEKKVEESLDLADKKPPYDDPYGYFAAVVKGTIKPAPFDLSSLENNMVVMEILDAGIRSAKSGKRIYLK